MCRRESIKGSGFEEAEGFLRVWFIVFFVLKLLLPVPAFYWLECAGNCKKANNTSLMSTESNGDGALTFSESKAKRWPVNGEGS